MNKNLLFIFLILLVYNFGFVNMITGYEKTSRAQLTVDEDIYEVKIGMYTKTSCCAGASPTFWPAIYGLPYSIVNRYNNYTGGSEQNKIRWNGSPLFYNIVSLSNLGG